jgi:multiple sugar transport system ATP-binding protein
VRQGEDAELWFSLDSMHVFDPKTGENVTRSEEKAKQIAAESEEERLRQLAQSKPATVGG